jgi:L-threonylcarbamoyladenylate synthase
MSAPPLTTDPAVAGAALAAGRLVGLPTETVYGLAARADDDEAVRAIFTAKERPAASPLIVHLADAADLDAWADDVPAAARLLAAACWPGPLTLVLRSSGRAARATVAGRATVALRVPGHPLARAAIAAAGVGVAAPSANRHGAVSPTTAAHVAEAFTADVVACVLDGGPSGVGVESTILDLSRGEPTILRHGGLGQTVIERLLQAPVAVELPHLAADRLDDAEVAAPGQARSHYAPRATVVLVESIEELKKAVDDADGPVGVIAAADEEDVARTRAEALLVAGDAEVLARGLFAALREADARGLRTVIALPPTTGDLALAVRDRLERAAAPRE